MAGIKSAAGKLAARVKPAAQRAFGLEKLEKAVLIRLHAGARAERFTVQFNPATYQITRGVTASKKRPVGKDCDEVKAQVVHGNMTTLSVELYFDSYSDLKSFGLSDLKDAASTVRDVAKTFGAGAGAGAAGAIAADMGKTFLLPEVHTEVNSVCEQILGLIKYQPEEHVPPVVEFLWGDLDFQGVILSSGVTYTMFAPDGTPVRAKLSLQLSGEERRFLRGQYPFESPDRTKERLLPAGDQLWMLANAEYGDPGMWKEIAKANGVLNPRKLSGAMRLKVPSVQ